MCFIAVSYIVWPIVQNVKETDMKRVSETDLKKIKKAKDAGAKCCIQ